MQERIREKNQTFITPKSYIALALSILKENGKHLDQADFEVVEANSLMFNINLLNSKGNLIHSVKEFRKYNADRLESS